MRKIALIVLATAALIAIASRPRVRSVARQKLGSGRQMVFRAVGRARSAMGQPARSGHTRDD